MKILAKTQLWPPKNQALVKTFVFGCFLVPRIASGPISSPQAELITWICLRNLEKKHRKHIPQRPFSHGQKGSNKITSTKTTKHHYSQNQPIKHVTPFRENKLPPKNRTSEPTHPNPPNPLNYTSIDPR